MVNSNNDSSNTKHRIEVALIAMRCSIRYGIFFGDSDPFIAYQDAHISKRKLIEIIANELTRD